MYSQMQINIREMVTYSVPWVYSTESYCEVCCLLLSQVPLSPIIYEPIDIKHHVCFVQGVCVYILTRRAMNKCPGLCTLGIWTICLW